MACPFLDSVCSGRSSADKYKDIVTVSITGKTQILKPHMALRKDQLCYYEVSGGKEGELAT